MAQGGRKGGSNAKPGNKSGSRSGAKTGSKTGSKTGAKKSKAAIASAGKSGGDKMPFIIGGAAILVIVVIIVVGLIINSSKTAIQAEDYGSSVNSVATVDDSGIVTVTAPDASDPVVIDMWEDSICPICADMEHQYGRQIAQAVDAGVLTVRYHMVDFLNSGSASGTYSTRAYAAMISVAKQDGSDPGLWLNFHSALFDSDNQPKENGSSDLSNDDLADIAGVMGASEAAQDKISDGAQVDAAGEDAKANFDKLTAIAQKAGRRPGTPTVAQDGVPVNTGSTDWLTNLLPDDYTPPEPSGTDGSEAGSTTGSNAGSN